LSSRINAPVVQRSQPLYKFAENIVAGKGLWLEGFGFAARPPIYPCFLALAAWAGGSYLWVVLPQALFGATTVAFAYLIGKRLFGERAALLSAALTAIYPYYVVHDTALEETSLVTMLTAISVYALLRAQASANPIVWGGAGVALAVDALCRLTMLPYALAALIWIGLFGDVSWKMRALRGGVGFLCLAALVGAWVARNDNLLGRHRSQYGGRLSVLDGAQCTDLLTLSRGEHRSEHRSGL
jgi:4-amino-4-deoxy-L-arabinose transferase-like glycosyltransferase